MTALRVGGVPEHFNWPWRRWIETGGPAALGLAVDWRDVPAGSGAMAAQLTSGELDVAMLLTEGAVAGIANGGAFAIVSLYTLSPLVWGIHVPAASALRDVADLRGARYAVSRAGSGSQLMAAVHARQQGWDPPSSWVPVGSLEGAVEAFAAGKADVFFWEKLMTKPLVDAGRFRRVGELVAPWPAFVVCCSRRALAARRAEAMAAIGALLATTAGVAAAPATATAIAARYGLALADVRPWLAATRWARHIELPRGLAAVAAALEAIGAIPGGFDAAASVSG